MRSRHLVISNANFTTESVILTLEMICHENSSGKFYTCNETSSVTRRRHLISNANFTTESVILTLEMICHENSSGKFYTCNETSIGVMCGSSSRFCNYTPINQFTDNLTPTYYEDVSRFNLFKAFTTWKYSIVALNTLITRVYKSRTKYRKYLSVGNLKYPAIFYQWA